MFALQRGTTAEMSVLKRFQFSSVRNGALSVSQQRLHSFCAYSKWMGVPTHSVLRKNSISSYRPLESSESRRHFCSGTKDDKDSSPEEESKEKKEEESTTAVASSAPTDEDTIALNTTEEDEESDDETEEDEEIGLKKTVHLLPREIVSELDRHIVGQDEAKRAVAIALRNRWRRQQLPQEMKDEIMPKNILMIGPTGVGKTEIARRLAKLAQAPFLKVEATKYTEVGFHGRDVDQIIRDLVDVGINETKAHIQERNKKRIQKNAENKMLDLLTGEKSSPSTRKSFRRMLRNGLLDEREVEIEVTNSARGLKDDPHNFESMVRVIRDSLQMRSGSKMMKMKVKEAMPFLVKQEGEKIVNMDIVLKEAIEAVEQNGIVFIDEIDKIAHPQNASKNGADASAEGVQRDLLPLIEGTYISTKHGNVDTSKILFIASGAFYSSKPSDLLPELQGRLPIRVELSALTSNDLYRILTEPEANLIKQQQALMNTENINLEFNTDAIREIANMAAEVNHTVENIGARRLHTVIERIIEELSFNCDKYSGEQIIDKEKVKECLSPLLKKTDLSKFVL